MKYLLGAIALMCVMATVATATIPPCECVTRKHRPKPNKPYLPDDTGLLACVTMGNNGTYTVDSHGHVG